MRLDKEKYMYKIKESSFRPFKNRIFLVMWIAGLVSNIGTWMYSLSASWLMTSLSASPLIIALVQTATTLPIFLFALPAGALADIFDRRTILILINIMMLAASSVFTIMVWQEAVSAIYLLIFTFLLGSGAAFMAPAWQSVIPQIVPKGDLPQAVVLCGISINLSRAIGPALAGLLISMYGLTSPFIVNSLSFVVVIVLLWWWEYSIPPVNKALPPERVWSAIKLGIRYACHSKSLKVTIFHVLGFMFFANAFWGLLPIISKNQFDGDVTFFGMLMGGIGFGSVSGAFILPKFRSRLTINQIVAVGAIGTSFVTGYFSIATDQTIALMCSFVFGISWIFVLSSVNVSAQQALPDWVRARGLAVFMMTFFGSISLGAAFWGWLAGFASVKIAMLSAAIGGISFAVLSFRLELQQGRKLDLTPSNHWPEPVVYEKVKYKAGPVIIQIFYDIDEKNRIEFLEAIYQLKPVRNRNGAYHWGVYEDTERKGHFVENFMEESWAAHLRHHERVTQSDKPLQDAVLEFHKGKEPPIVKHLLASYN